MEDFVEAHPLSVVLDGFATRVLNPLELGLEEFLAKKMIFNKKKTRGI